MASQPIFCWPEYNPANGLIYGALYNAYVFNSTSTKRVCPIGYRVAATGDFTRLMNILSAGEYSYYNYSSSNIGAAIRNTSLTTWSTPNEASNSTGLSFNGSGVRDNSGTFLLFKQEAYFPSNPTGFISGPTANMQMSRIVNSNAVLQSVTLPAGNGISIRCIKMQ